MKTIDISSLLTIPFLDTTSLQDRFISSMMFHEAKKWRMWVSTGDSLVEIPAWPAEAYYFSAAPESPADINFHFLNLIAQQACFLTLQKPFSGLQDDIFNLSASLAKISHLHATKDIVGTGVKRMIVTEVEYLFSICRSIFDLLQEIAHALWETIQLHDSSIKKKPLKKTFSKMVFFENRITTTTELIQRFGLPTVLAEYYVRNSKFFMTLREFRDNIIHGGSQVQTIFENNTGFLVQHSMKPFSKMEIWKEEEKQNGLAPLLPALGMVIHNTIAACEDFSSTIAQTIQLPPPIVPKMNYYMRGYFNESFLVSLRDANERVKSFSNGLNAEPMPND